MIIRYSVHAPATGTQAAGERARFSADSRIPGDDAAMLAEARTRAVELAEEYAILCARFGALRMAAYNPVHVYRTGTAAPVYAVRTVQCDQCERPMLADDAGGAPVAFRPAYDTDGRPLCSTCEAARDPLASIAAMPGEAVPS
jgi:hypothetical protein